MLANSGASLAMSTGQEALIWVGIAICILHSAMFSGLNLAVLGISRLRLEVEASAGNTAAGSILALRRDSNFLLTTILWGNVGFNCLLTLLSDSVLAGVGAFFFSTVVITFVGEITPQAYFSRNALRMGALLAPVLRFYQKLFYPVAKSSALLLDWWLGRENIQWLREHDLRAYIERHVESEEADDLGHVEGMGAVNFLALDDLVVGAEGRHLHPKSVIPLPVNVDLPVIPEIRRDTTDPFLQQVQESGEKWIVLVDPSDEPRLVLDADGFIRGALFDGDHFRPYAHCHRPIIVRNEKTLVGKVIKQLRVEQESTDDDVIDHDLILLWGSQKRVITGADLLGRLLRGIARRDRDER